ncbi:MAG: hypothetical protein HOG97_01590 [Candidatus Marinimicrobia bacterium]|nr:hypothetical protein [Candidatus Neomarinimicrobiota bacterium]
MANVFRTFLEKLGDSTASEFIGSKGDLFFDPDLPSPVLKISDGSTAGGISVNGEMGGTMTGHIIPDANDTYDIGSAEFKIRDAYISDNTIYMGDEATIRSEGTAIVVQDLKTGDLHLDNTHRDGNSVDGTSGSWTFEEGENELFLLNNISGKTYKINLTEI